jgi:hypothetical protein
MGYDTSGVTSWNIQGISGVTSRDRLLRRQSETNREYACEYVIVSNYVSNVLLFCNIHLRSHMRVIGDIDYH